VPERFEPLLERPFERLTRQRFEGIVIHHSASRTDDLASIRRMHREVRGWSDAAYHVVVANGSTDVPAGAAEPSGRYRLLKASSATKFWDYNLNWLHICVVGNYEEAEVPASVRIGLGDALSRLMDEFGVDWERVVLHRDLDATACPGKYVTVARLKEWTAAADGSVGASIAAHNARELSDHAGRVLASRGVVVSAHGLASLVGIVVFVAGRLMERRRWRSRAVARASG
jgi:hypothetical protein